MVEKVKIFCTNIRSLNENYDNLLLALQDLKDVKGIEYEIIALTETWVAEEQFEHFNIDGYRSFIQPRTDMRSGGVVVYVKHHLNIEHLQKFETHAFTAIKMQIATDKQQNLSVLLIYRNCKASKVKFTEELEGIVGDDVENQVFLGDVNINLFDNVQSAQYQNLLMSLGYISIHTRETRST